MAKIGYLLPSEDGSTEYFTGEIATMRLQLAFELRANENPRSDRAPTHLALVRVPNGTEYHVGAGWLREAKHGPHRGRKFLSLSFDSPDMPRPLNVAAYPPEDGTGEWEIAWRRRTQPDQDAA